MLASYSHSVRGTTPKCCNLFARAERVSAMAYMSCAGFIRVKGTSEVFFRVLDKEFVVPVQALGSAAKKPSLISNMCRDVQSYD